MERGDVTPAVTIHEKEDIILEKGPTVTEEPVEDGDEASGSRPTTSTKMDDEGEVGPTTPEHEGSLILAEWREGPHQVIERKTGSSEEVRSLLSYHRAFADTNGLRFLVGRGRGPPKCLRARKFRTRDLSVRRRRVRSQECCWRLSPLVKGGYSKTCWGPRGWSQVC